jgi:hypothetical protein
LPEEERFEIKLGIKRQNTIKMQNEAMLRKKYIIYEDNKYGIWWQYF